MKGERAPLESGSSVHFFSYCSAPYSFLLVYVFLDVLMNRANSPARRTCDTPGSAPRSAKSSLRLKRPSIRISNVNEPSTYRPDWRNLIVFKVSHTASSQSHIFSIEANVTTFVWRTVEFVCQQFELDSKG